MLSTVVLTERHREYDDSVYPYEFRPYPFGALVLYVHPEGSPFPDSKSKGGLRTKKWRSTCT